MTSTPKPLYKKSPCPHRILEDIGAGLFHGIFSAGMYHFTKGINTPPHRQPIYNGLTTVRMNAPRYAGEIALWWGLLSAGECTMLYVRQKDDPWNSIISGAVTGGLLAVRSRVVPITSGAVLGGCLLALLEGGEIMLMRKISETLYKEDADERFGEF